MKKLGLTLRQRERRLLLLLSAFVITLMAIPSLYASASSADGGAFKMELRKVKMYQWTRVYGNDDIPDSGAYKIILSWTHKDNGKVYGTIGYGNEEEDNNEGVVCHPLADLRWYDRNGNFYSPNDLNAFDAQARAYDNDNGGAERCVIATSKGHGLKAEWMVGKDEFRYADSIGDGTAWTIITAKQHGSYSVENGYVKVIYNSAGDDIVMERNGDRLSCCDEDRGATSFIMHVGTEIWYDAITEDLTIPHGTTLSIPNGVMLCKNVTLTVEPGAVLLIEGKFIANGVIKNYGTILVADGGRYEPFCPETSNAGLIFCYGGSTKYFCGTVNKNLPAEGHLIVMPGGKMNFAAGHGMLLLYNGSVCANLGEMSLPDNFVVDGATFENRKGGKVTTGRPEVKVLSVMYSRQQIMSLGLLQCIDCRGSAATITNKGTWDNYSEIVGGGNARVTGVKSF